jgi:SAM-dependent methyltransferase/tetratricopeptide (TPR) repeat protein
MHDTAAAFGAAFFRCYVDAIEGARILEVGASNVNGSLRGCAPFGSRYTGIDLTAGLGVDTVLNDPYSYPFDSDSFDVVVSSSCMEHDPLFWLSFIEMCRVVRPGGFIYLNAPSNGPFHRYPTDNWRFYPDAGLALATWGRRNGHDVHLIESLIGRRRHDVWNDCVMVFAKGEAPRPLRLLAELFPRSFNIRLGETDVITNYSEPTEDMMLRTWLFEKLNGPSNLRGDDEQASIEALISSLAEREVALVAVQEERTAQEAALSEANRRNAELVAKLTEAERALAAAEIATAAQISSKKEVEAEIALLHKEKEELKKALAELDVKFNQANEEIGEQRQYIQRLQDELAVARSDLLARNHALDDAVQLADELATELRTLRGELAASDAALTAAERDAIEAREERDRIAEQVKDLARERDRLAQENDRWFEAAILAPAQDVMGNIRPRTASESMLRRWYGGSRRKAIPSSVARADRARDERRWECAARFYLDALRRRPDRTAIWIQLGHALKEAGKISEAEFAYRRAVQLDANNFDALLPLGEVLKRLGRKEEAATTYAQAKELAPTEHLRETIVNELSSLGR